MLLTMRHEARRAPMTFLYATLRRLRSSTESWGGVVVVSMLLLLFFWGGEGGRR